MASKDLSRVDDTLIFGPVFGLDYSKADINEIWMMDSGGYVDMHHHSLVRKGKLLKAATENAVFVEFFLLGEMILSFPMWMTMTGQGSITPRQKPSKVNNDRIQIHSLPLWLLLVAQIIGAFRAFTASKLVFLRESFSDLG